MYYTIIGLIVLLPLLWLAVWGIKGSPRHNVERTPTVAQAQDTKDKNSNTKPPPGTVLTRQDLALRLKKLAESQPPQELNTRGAMCYEPVALPTKVEYVCPRCGERTQYTTDNREFVQYQIPVARNLAKQITELPIELDESAFCKKCNPKALSPMLDLVVRYTGEKTPLRIQGVTSSDLKILKEFLSGVDRHKGDRDEETPMKDHLERLQQLLGIDLKSPSSKTP